MVIILHNPTSGDKSRFNRQPKRLETTKKSTLKFLSLQEHSNISLKSRFNRQPKRLETTKKSTRSRPRYLDANWRIRVFSPTIDFCKSFTASINSHELTS